MIAIGRLKNLFPLEKIGLHRKMFYSTGELRVSCRVGGDHMRVGAEVHKKPGSGVLHVPSV